MTTTLPPAGPASWRVVPLAEVFANHDEFQPQPTDQLAGQELELRFEDGFSIAVNFEDPGQLRWRADRSLPWGTEGAARYQAATVREGLYAVTVSRLEDNASALVVLDRLERRALANLTIFAEVDGSVHERTTFLQAGIDSPLMRPFARTTELVGKRVAHRYSTTHVFEHIYLNPNTYAFQGLAGPEAGFAAVDPADYWKLGKDLYLFSWHERMRPFNGAVVNDLARGRATGRLIGWDERAGRALEIRTGSQAKLLSVTSYDEVCV